MKNEIEVSIKGVAATPAGVGLFLGNDEKVIAIFVDQQIGTTITMYMQGMETPRPLTHELIASILEGLNVRLAKVIINELRDDTFYARLILVQDSELGKKIVEIDARSSDAIAIALRQKTPIRVHSSVWQQAEDMSWALKKLREDQGEETGSQD